MEAPIKASKSSKLYLWVLLAIFLGGALGYLSPQLGETLKPLADAFIALIRMLITPIIFCTVVIGIASMAGTTRMGHVTGKAFILFETISTLALILGLVVANVLQLGVGFAVDTSQLNTASIKSYSQAASNQGTIVDYILHIIPKTVIDAFTANGSMLQILLVAVLFGFAMLKLKDKAQPFYSLIESANKILFCILNMIIKLAPIGAGGAMAFTVGKYGTVALKSLFYFVGTFYLTCAFFIIVVLGTLAWYGGFSLFKFIRYIKNEIIIVLGTASSETALVPLMEKLNHLGCHKNIVSLVVPLGYSFNMDGSYIYLSMAILFIAHAFGIDLSLTQQLTILAIAMLTSKGAAGVTGSAFITLAATLVLVPNIPLTGLALILGIDRFMNEARSVTNFISNGVVALIVSRWEKALNSEKLTKELNA